MLEYLAPTVLIVVSLSYLCILVYRNHRRYQAVDWVYVPTMIALSVVLALVVHVAFATRNNYSDPIVLSLVMTCAMIVMIRMSLYVSVKHRRRGK